MLGSRITFPCFINNKCLKIVEKHNKLLEYFSLLQDLSHVDFIGFFILGNSHQNIGWEQTIWKKKICPLREHILIARFALGLVLFAYV